jgi:hypothetical protein
MRSGANPDQHPSRRLALGGGNEWQVSQIGERFASPFVEGMAGQLGGVFVAALARRVPCFGQQVLDLKQIESVWIDHQLVATRPRHDGWVPVARIALKRLAEPEDLVFEQIGESRGRLVVPDGVDHLAFGADMVGR